MAEQRRPRGKVSKDFMASVPKTIVRCLLCLVLSEYYLRSWIHVAERHRSINDVTLLPAISDAFGQQDQPWQMREFIDLRVHKVMFCLSVKTKINLNYVAECSNDTKLLNTIGQVSYRT